MGAGKSTVGQVLAERLGWDFVDLDARVESGSGLSIPEIFDREGEAGFRLREREALAVVLADGPAVLACGGGTPVQPGVLPALKTWGRVVYLQADLEVLAARVQGGGRPLWGEDVAARLEARGPCYRRADLIVDGSAVPERVADAIQAGLGLGEWR